MHSQTNCREAMYHQNQILNMKSCICDPGLGNTQVEKWSANQIEMSNTILDTMPDVDQVLDDEEIQFRNEKRESEESLDESRIEEELDEVLYIVEESQNDETEIENIEEPSAAGEVAAGEVDVDEAGAEEAAVEEVLYPDPVAPLMKLLVFNIVLPTIDIFFDSILIKKLFEDGSWGSGQGRKKHVCHFQKVFVADFLFNFSFYHDFLGQQIN